MFSSIKKNVLVALGSNSSDNLADTVCVVDRAIEMLLRKSIKLSNKSQFYQTPAFPMGAGPDFINCVLAAETELSPDELLSDFHAIEADLGRVRVNRWEQRVIDIDLLCYEDLVKPNEDVVKSWIGMALSDQMERTPEQMLLPHPRIQDRPFVLVPMRDVAPDWVHPILGKTTVEMCDALPDDDVDEIRKYQPNN
jgi:2-amino-4-hydroxy-6-hydroxymethyldihydropteridine diphosphokinase